MLNVAAVRQEVVDALRDVEGINASLYRPPAPEVGDTWLQQTSLIRDEPSGQFVNQFYVVVFLPQGDQVLADEFMSDHWSVIVDALEDVGYADRIDYIALNVGDKAQLALQITLRS